MRNRLPSASAGYVLAVVFTSAAVAARALLTPWLGANLPFVTLFAAVAAAVWVGGYRPAIVAAVLGFLVCDFLFIESSGRVTFYTFANVIGMLAFFVSCAILIAFGELMRRAQARRQRSERDLADFFDNASVGLHWVGPDGIILRANQTELDLLGYRREEYVGRHIAEFHADRGVIDDMLARLARGETLRDCPARMRCKDGSIRDMLIDANVLFEDGKFIHTRCFTRDVTLANQVEQALRDSEAHLLADLCDTRLLQDISAQLIHDEGAAGLYEKILDAAVGIMRSEFASMQMLHPERGPGGELQLLAFRGFTPEAAKFWEWVRPDSESICGAALRSGKRVIVTDIEQCGPMAGTDDLAMYWQTGIRAVQSTPLLSRGGNVVGMISTHWKGPHKPSERDLRLFDILARQAADVIERKQAEQALRESEQRFRSLTQAITSVVWTTDAEGRFVTPQPSWSQYTGQSWEEARGFGWADAIHADDRQAIRDLWRAACEFKTKYNSACRLWHAASGDYRHVEARGVPIVNADGSVKEWVGKCLDVEDRRRAEEALRDSDRRKDEFLAMLAHELRNPLAPVINSLELMQRAKGDPAIVEQAQATVKAQIEQMVRLIDDLLDVSRISRNKLELRRARVELAPIIRQAVEACRHLAAKADHDVSLTLPPETIHLHADMVRLVQVFGNLLTNACKYTEPGGKIGLTVERQGSDAVVTVKDTGVGIPADMLAKVFDMFTQIDRSLERSQGGLGIGLSLVKRLVEMHEGSVSAHSDGQGRGSEFVVRLPVLLDAPTEESPSEPGVPSESIAAHRILVVDDQRETATLLAKLLEMSGHTTQAAFDGVEAVEAAEKFRPDIILLDIGLPRLNGYDACRKIREQPWGKDMVLIAVTGWGQEGDRQKSKDAGFSGHLVKPVKYEHIVTLLAALETPAV